MATFSKHFVSIVLFLTVLGASSAANAHAHLKSHYPASNVEITPAPLAITLNFSEGIEPRFSRVKVSSSKQETVKMSKAYRNSQDEKQLIAPIAEVLKPDVYYVQWQVVSVDGHKTKGSYQFTVK